MKSTYCFSLKKFSAKNVFSFSLVFVFTLLQFSLSHAALQPHSQDQLLPQPHLQEILSLHSHDFFSTKGKNKVSKKRLSEIQNENQKTIEIISGLCEADAEAALESKTMNESDSKSYQRACTEFQIVSYSQTLREISNARVQEQKLKKAEQMTFKKL